MSIDLERLIADVIAVKQRYLVELFAMRNVVGIGIAVPLGQHPLFGVLNSSVTLVGGPATGLAFAPLFEKAGINGAASTQTGAVRRHA